MNRYTLLFLFFLFNLSLAKSQWKDVATYTNDFGTNKATFNKEGGNVVSKKGKSVFLPEPPSGFTRVSIHPLAENGAFNLIGNSSLEITQPKARPIKFSGYGITSASSLLYTKCKMTFSANTEDASAGSYTLAFGNDSGPNDNSIFKNTGNTLYRSTGEIFSALRWTLSSASTITFAYRVGSDASKTTTYKTINNTGFVQGKTYQVEIYCNNSGSDQTYGRGASSYALPNNTFNLWIDGVQVGGNLPRSIEVDGDAGLSAGTSVALENKAPLNSYIFIADGAAAAHGKLTLSDLSLIYNTAVK